MARCLVVFTVLLWAPVGVWGQDSPLSEDDVVSKGLEGAGFDARRRGLALVGEGESLSVSAWDNPQLSYEREQLSGDIADLDAMSVSQHFDLSGRRGLRGEAASLRAQSQLKDLEWARAQYALEVRGHFHALLYLQTRVGWMEVWHRHLQEVHDIIEARVESGDASLLELRRIEGALALVKSRLDGATIERARAWSRLDALAGGLSEGAWPRVQGELLPEDGPAAEKGEFALRADVQALELEKRSLELEADAAARGWVPGLDLGLGYLRQSGGPGGSDDADGFSLMIGLSLPLFSRGQGEALSARGQAQVLSARRERMAFRLERRAGSALGELSRRLELARTFRSTVARADETAQLAREAYEGNALPLGELLNVYEHLHTVQQHAATLDWQARRAHIESLRLLGGRP